MVNEPVISASFEQSLTQQASALGFVPKFDPESLRGAKDADLPGILAAILQSLNDHETRLLTLENGVGVSPAVQ